MLLLCVQPRCRSLLDFSLGVIAFVSLTPDASGWALAARVCFFYCFFCRAVITAAKAANAHAFIKVRGEGGGQREVLGDDNRCLYAAYEIGVACRCAVWQYGRLHPQQETGHVHAQREIKRERERNIFGDLAVTFLFACRFLKLCCLCALAYGTYCCGTRCLRFCLFFVRLGGTL